MSDGQVRVDFSNLLGIFFGNCSKMRVGHASGCIFCVVAAAGNKTIKMHGCKYHMNWLLISPLKYSGSYEKYNM